MATAALAGHLGATDNQKRWLVAGIALNKILIPQIRPFVEQEIGKEYNNLKTSHNLHTQSATRHLKTWPTTTTKDFLKYENINGNEGLPKVKKHGRYLYDYNSFNYQVTSHVDFARLFVQNYMAKFTAFDDHCDVSAVLLLLGHVPVFPAAVQTAAGDVRMARNDWAHCVFSNWDQAKFLKSFSEMEQLVKSLALPIAGKLIGELKDWETKGTALCMNSPVDPALLQLVQQELKSLQDDVDNMSVEIEDEKAKVQSELQTVAKTLEKMKQRVKNLEYRAEVAEGRMDDFEGHVHEKMKRLESSQQNTDSRTRLVEDKVNVFEDSVHHLQEQVHDLSKAKESDIAMPFPESPKSGDHPEELAELIRRNYKGAVLCPFPWCEDELQMELSKIFTRLKIVGRKKERARLSEDIVDMTDAFRAHEECEKPRVVLIEGEPGMGKTTYCQKLAYDWSVEDISPEASFPKVNMLLKLKCRDMKTANIEDALDDQLLPFDLDQKDKGNFFRFIRGNQSRILLVLDGLDELPQDLFEGLLPLIKGRVFPHVYLMLTARHEAGTKVRQHCDTLLEIVGYTNEDANSYIEKYFSKHDDPSLGEKLIQLLDRDPELRELTANPLNTALLCLVYEDAYGIFPYNKTMLYDELVSCVLTRTFSKKGIPLPDNKDPIEVCTDQLNQLGKFALEALLKDQLAFTPGQLSQSTEFLEFGFLSREASASKIRPKPTYAFTNKTFQEYFAAFYLAHELLTGESDKAALLAQLSPVDKYWQVWEFLITMAASKSDEIAVLLVSSLCALFERKIPEGFYKHRRRRDLEDVCSDTSYEWFEDRLWERSFEEELFVTKTIYTIGQCEQPQSELKQYQKEMAATLARCFPLDKMKVTDPYDNTSFACRYIALLSEYLKGNYQLKYLAWGTELDGLPLETIEHVLQSRHKLTQLHLCNDLHSTSLTPILQATRGLKYLNLRGARIGDVGAKVLGEALQSNHTLTHLNLRDARIGDAGAKALGEVLQSNCSLTHLRLPRKNITYIGAEALAKGLLSNNVLVHLDIRGNRIGDQGAVAFSKALESNRTLSYLNVGVQSDRFLPPSDFISAGIKYECIGDSGIRAIAHALRSNNSLSYLDIRGSTFSDSAAAALGEALQSNCSLTHLYLRGFMGIPVHFGNSAAAAFSKAFQSRGTQLTRLDLHDTSISSSCVITLAEGLQSNHTLERLDLSRNKIEYSGAAALAQALKTNQTLTHLQLRNNTIGDSGSKELVEALECNETLMFLDLYSNRTSWLGVEDLKALNGRLHTDLLWPDVKWTRY